MLRAVSVLVLFGIFPTLASAIPAGSETLEPFAVRSACAPLGDVDGDGKVTPKDVSIVNDILSSARVPTEAQVFEADVTNDGKITASDTAEISAYLKGTIPSFSGCVAYAPALARAVRDAQRLADLSAIREALTRYARDTGTYPTYPLIGTPSSDVYWKSNTSGSDFRRRLKYYLNPLPVDPLSSELENFRYVYATIPSFNPPWGAPCAGNTILFATRVETSATGYDECDLGDGRNHFTRIIASHKTALSNNSFASALASFWQLFSKAEGEKETY